MSKKANAFFVLLAFLVDLGVIFLWYDTLLYPTEVMPHIKAVLGGAAMFLITLCAVIYNAFVYDTAIAEG